MAPPLLSWKKLIDNGNLIDGALTNATELLAAKVPAGGDAPPSDPLKSPQQLPPGGSVGLGNDLLPVYCGVLGCLIVSLVAWIVIKQLRNRPAQEDSKQLADQPPQQMPEEEAEHPGQHHHQHQHHQHHRHLHHQAQDQEQQHLFHIPLLGQKRRSADSGFGGDSEAAAAAASAAGSAEASVGADIRRRLLRDLSESRLQRLENILANDSNPDGWRRLARELGLSAEDLAKLECQSARGNQSAIRLMLKTWAARDGSSVGQLIRCLQRAGRSDALILFRESAVPAGLRRAQRKMRKQQQQLQQQQQQQEQQQRDQQPEVVAVPTDAEAADTAEAIEPSTTV